MATTIQISGKLQIELTERKLLEKETYEEVIWDLIEDSKELNKETKNELERARAEIKAGKTKTLSKIKEELGL
ncbi:MAG: hypothetical protein HZB66_03215 [Candidatus Aenigmarchaeota archaeon]|nr:hypothetical protein [Candidatus Aenigmarchaeota archaeon]